MVQNGRRKRDVIHVIDRLGYGLDVEKARKLKPRKFLLKGYHACNSCMILHQ